MSPSTPVNHIVGLAAISGNGLNKEQVFAAVQTGQVSINDEGLCSISPASWEKLAQQTPEALRHSKCTQLSAVALSQAIAEAGWNTGDIADCGFIFSSTTGQIDCWESTLPAGHLKHTKGDPEFSLEENEAGIRNQSLGLPMIHLCEHFKIGGPRTLIASSCSASLQALGIALLWMRTKKVSRCIVGATEIHSALTKTGFQSLRLLSRAACHPFDKARNGINLGEGSAFILLEAEGGKPKHSYGNLAGFGISSDAFHPTSPRPEGVGSQRAMQMALNSAGLKSEQVNWVYAHGTGSAANDLAEAQAIKQIFPHSPSLTSTKAVHGHTLAASGVLESVLGLMAMQQNLVLGTANCTQPDLDLGVNIQTKTSPQAVSSFLKNSLGFGGMNASILFTAPKEKWGSQR